MVTKTEALVIGDVLVWEADRKYCVEEWLIENAVASEVTFVVGVTLEPGTSATTQKIPCGTAANADSILLEKVTVAASSNSSLASVLIRGPAVVNGDNLDYNSQTVATVDAALLDELILVKTGPTYTADTADLS